MVRRVKGKTLKLEGFNNLTKSISFNIYDICYARSRESQIEYLEYVDEEYNSKRLEEIVENVTRMINAKLVSVSTQDYDPRGASVVALINEGSPVADEHIKSDKEQTGPAPFVIGHLDKSHIAIHTYPEYHRLTGLASFRVDIDISTCGMISPLSALNYLIESFDSEVVIIDYRVRGFTRDHKGRKVFIDHCSNHTHSSSIESQARNTSTPAASSTASGAQRLNHSRPCLMKSPTVDRRER